VAFSKRDAPGGDSRGRRSGLNFTHLTKTLSAILAIEGSQLHTPSSLPVRANRDMTRYCEYHKGNGHNTDECHELG
jgi:hypothetical protein